MKNIKSSHQYYRNCLHKTVKESPVLGNVETLPFLHNGKLSGLLKVYFIMTNMNSWQTSLPLSHCLLRRPSSQE